MALVQRGARGRGVRKAYHCERYAEPLERTRTAAGGQVGHSNRACQLCVSNAARAALDSSHFVTLLGDAMCSAVHARALAGQGRCTPAIFGFWLVIGFVRSPRVPPRRHSPLLHRPALPTAMTLLASARSGRPLQSGCRTACARRPRALPPRALFGLFTPSKPKSNANAAQDLVNELLQSVEGTDGGLKASQARREQIAQLVDELEGCCPRNPLRSPLLFGEYEVLYASKPQAAGGPFRSPIGRAVFPGQRAVQLIEVRLARVECMCGTFPCTPSAMCPAASLPLIAAAKHYCE